MQLGLEDQLGSLELQDLLDQSDHQAHLDHLVRLDPLVFQDYQASLVIKVLLARQEVLVHVVQQGLVVTKDNLGLLDSKDHQDL